jgi:hypothetical protein
MEDASLTVTFSADTNPKDLDKKLTAAAKSVEKEKEKMFQSLYKLALDAAESKVRVRKGTLRDSLHKGRRNSASYVDHNGFALASQLPYARQQDNAERWGVKPAWPNVTALRNWVASAVKPPAAELDSVTFLIGRKLSTTNPKPTNYLEYAAERVRLRMTHYSDQMARNMKIKFK